MNGLRKSLLPLFLLSSAVFLGGILFLTKNHSPYKLLYNESSFSKSVEKSQENRNESLKWEGAFIKKGSSTIVADVSNNFYLKKMGLKKGDEIIRLNSFYKPSLERTVDFLKNSNNKVINLILKRDDKLYKTRFLPLSYYQ